MVNKAAVRLAPEGQWMRCDSVYHVWRIAFPDERSMRDGARLIKEAGATDARGTDERTRFGQDGSVVEKEVHLVRDSFTEILVLEQSSTEPWFLRVLFWRSPSAPRFWKDMMVRLLRETTSLAADAAVTLEYRGDDDPR